jgi:D-lactate dehydrogenase (cytochrome)
MVKRVHQAGQEVMELCVRQGGTITGEHGVGSEKRQYMPLMFNADELRVMQDIKDVFDPNGLLNPGKIFPEQAKPEAGGRRLEVGGSRLEVGGSKLEVGGWKLEVRGQKSEIQNPKSTQEAADAVSAWASLAQPPSLRIRGGGTKSNLLPPADVTLSTGALRGIQACSLDDLCVTAGAGTPLAELQQELARDRMWAPLASPWPACTLGGLVATNFNAPLRMRYGALRDLILAMTVVLPDGRIIRAGRAVVKNVAGYDLPKLFVGSHGTLGLITDVTLKLMPFPRARASLIAPIDDLGRGLALGTRLLRVCLAASALLLCHGCNIPGVPAPYALIHTAEGVPEDVAAELAQARGVLQAEGITGVTLLDNVAGSDVWGDWLSAASPTDTTLRLGVPPKDLSKTVSGLAPVLQSPFIADVASGMLYARNTNVEAARQSARSVGGYAIVLSGPSASANGSQSDVWGHTPDGLDLMRAIKARYAARAHGLFNAGAFVV